MNVDINDTELIKIYRIDTNFLAGVIKSEKNFSSVDYGPKLQ